MGVFLVVATATIFKCHWLRMVSIVPSSGCPRICLLGSQGVSHVADDLACVWSVSCRHLDALYLLTRETLHAIWVDNREGDGVSGVSSHSPVAPVPTEYVNARISFLLNAILQTSHRVHRGECRDLRFHWELHGR